MQASWRNDADKLTFIVCASPYAPNVPTATQLEQLGGTVAPKKHDIPESMVGDVNLFLVDDDEDEEEQVGEQAEKRKAVIGEVEIMIARSDARGKGLARETLVGFMWYIMASLSSILAEYAGGQTQVNYLKYLRVKIDKDNTRSLALFERVGFTRTSAEPNYFGEVEMRTAVKDGKLVDVERTIGLEGFSIKVEYR